MADEEKRFRNKVLDSLKKLAVKETPGWKDVGRKARVGMDFGKAVGVKAVGGVKPVALVIAVLAALVVLYFIVIGIISGTVALGLGALNWLKTGWFLIVLLIFAVLSLWLVYSSWQRTRNVFAVLIVILILSGIWFFGWRFYVSIPGDTPDAKFSGVWTRFGSLITSPFTKIKELQEKYEAQLEGDYFTGKVDENRYEQIGVYLDNVEAADPYFYSDEPVIIWATLNAMVLDEPINVEVSCESEGHSGVVIPYDEYEIDFSEQEDLECDLPASTFKEGVHKATFNADFNFKTIAYLKNYFIDRVRLRTMTREGIDVLSQYGITDRNPVAVYSNGPVSIGMDTETQPIGIYTQRDNTILLGVTLDNRWEGGMKEISLLIIQSPEGLVMRGSTCEGYEFEEDINSEEGYNTYVLNRTIRDVKSFKTFRCWFDVDNPTLLLGTTPIATRYFKVSAEYDYRLNKSAIFNIKQGDTVKTTLVRPAILLSAQTTSTDLTKGTVVWSDIEGDILTKNQIETYLDTYAAGKFKKQADLLWELGEKYDIDPSFAIAVAMHESWGGYYEPANEKNNWFGILGQEGQPLITFSSPERGIEYFYDLIKNNYVPLDQKTPYDIANGIPGTNNQHAYIVTGRSDWIYEVPRFRQKIRSMD